MVDNVHIKLSTGYDRTLRRGTVWLNVGSVAAGDVYRPRDTVFSLEGTNVHEAYLVLSDGRLVGYFLPAENSFVPQRAVSTSIVPATWPVARSSRASC